MAGTRQEPPTFRHTAPAEAATEAAIEDRIATAAAGDASTNGAGARGQAPTASVPPPPAAGPPSAVPVATAASSPAVAPGGLSPLTASAPGDGHDAHAPRPATVAHRPPWHRRTGWRIFGALAGALLVTAVILASVVPLPYYSLRPGSVYNTIERVEAPGELVSIPEGEIDFVTVSQTADINTWQWLDAKLDGNVRIRPAEEVRGDQTADELREADVRRMQLSKDAALVVALRKLGYDLITTPIGIEVAQVFPCTAADGTLGTGDLIIGVDGVDVRDGEQLVAALGEIGIGEEVELLVERIDPENPAQSIRTETVELTLGSADAPCLPDEVRADEPRAFIGIGTHTLVHEEFPIDIDVRTGSVGGPSAGVAIALGVMDVLSEGELTNGLHVVATGTIDRDGNVGPVGGIHQKTIAAARSGADLFIVPNCCDNFVDRTTGEPLDLESNYAEALQYAGDMKVVGVDTIDDALRALGEIGGDVEAFLPESE